MIVAVTGGIATGKSAFCSGLASATELPHLSCDAIVHELYGTEEVRAAIRLRFGGEIFQEDGSIDRRALAGRAFATDEDRRWLEELLHPRVLRVIEQELESQEKDAAGAVIEVPLLYEVDFPLKRDIDVTVACSSAIQLRRVRGRYQIDRDAAEQRIASQLPIFEKVRRADVVVWNDGVEATLHRQARLLAARLTDQ